jgi:two-component system chemotaxis sensor kinase CheA
MTEVDEDLAIRREAYDEASDILARLGVTLDDFTLTQDWRAAVDEAYRGVHTIKGNCAALGWQRASTVAHGLEAALTSWKSAESRPGDAQLRALRIGLDDLERVLTEQAEAAVESPPAPVVKAPARVAAPAPPAVSEARPTVTPTSASMSMSSAAAPTLTMAPKGKLFQEGQDSLRVPVHAVNGALNHIWEVFLLRSQIAYLFEEHRDALKGAWALVQAWEPLDAAMRRHVTELETVVMSMRLMNLRSLFTRMQQVLRSYAANHAEKRVRLVTTGEEIQVDKRVLDRLGESFIHLIRNAVDHGLEPAADRVAAGKAPEGTVRIDAESTADRIVIRMQDDGRGIRADKLIAKARERGIDVSNLSGEQDALDLIFRPGFSTAEEVTDVSGRGVGMDAVRTSIAELGGTLDLETAPGRGTTFVVTLPVSVSIVPVVLLDVNGETYATHVSGVIEVCRVSPKELHLSSGEPMLRFHDRFIRCVDLRAHMHGALVNDPAAEVEVCVVRRAGALLGMRVSHVLSTTEVVVKPLPQLSPTRPYVHGVSILPTGQAIFVLSLDHLADLALNRAPARTGGPSLAAA